VHDNVSRNTDRRSSMSEAEKTTLSEAEKTAISDAIGLALSKMSMSDIHRMLHEQNMDVKRIVQSHSTS